MKLSKTQLSKMVQLGGFLGRLLGVLLKTVLPLMKNVITPLAKSVLIPLRLTTTASAADAGIHKNLRIWLTKYDMEDDMEDIIKIVKSLEDSGLLLKRVSEKIQNEDKEQKGDFLSMLLDTLGVSLLGNILAGKGVTIAGNGNGSMAKIKTRSKNQGKGTVRAGYGNKADF